VSQQAISRLLQRVLQRQKSGRAAGVRRTLHQDGNVTDDAGSSLWSADTWPGTVRPASYGLRKVDVFMLTSYCPSKTRHVRLV